MEMNASVFMAIGCVIGMIGFISWGIVKNFEENLLTNSGRHTKEEIDNTKEDLDSSLQEEEIDDLIAEGEQVTRVEEDQTVEDLTNEINSLIQAQEFKDIAQLDGVVLTKMDGTGKGGIVVAIAQQLSLPVVFMSYGEQPEQLKLFNAAEYVSGLINN